MKPNANWTVSVNHGSIPAAFREPLPCRGWNPSRRKQFNGDKFTMYSGIGPDNHM